MKQLFLLHTHDGDYSRKNQKLIGVFNNLELAAKMAAEHDGYNISVERLVNDLQITNFDDNISYSITEVKLNELID